METIVHFCLESTCVYTQYIQDNVVVEHCSCDSHHTYIQVVIINLPTIICFGDVSFLNVIVYIVYLQDITMPFQAV